jgi:flagellar basal body L-ring protein FlgH
MKSLLLLPLLFIGGCASYVSGIHRQIDRDQRREQRSGDSSMRDPYAAYREQGFKRKRADRRPVRNPHSISALNPTNDVLPPVKRDYRAGGRTGAQDFVDTGQSGSLWVNSQGASMFTTEVTKKVGDIVVVNVLDNLRGQISSELKRAFPEPVKKVTGKKGEAAAAAAPPAPAADKGDELDTKVYDKISGVVAEEINKDYFLLRGKKEVIFRKEKRFIEVQALVARKDIADNDSINSDKLVESRVLIMR